MGPQHAAEPILCSASTDTMQRDAEITYPDMSTGCEFLPLSPQKMDPHVCSQERNVSPSFPAPQQPAAPRKCQSPAGGAQPLLCSRSSQACQLFSPCMAVGITAPLRFAITHGPGPAAEPIHQPAPASPARLCCGS